MATDPILITSPISGAEQVATAANRSWSILKEAPKLPVSIILFVALVAVFAPLIASHDPGAFSKAN